VTAPFGVVVVNYGSSALVERNLAGRAWGADVEVVVVDNLSTEAERIRIADVCARIGAHLVPREVNDGFGGGCNAGIGRARELGCTAFLLLNPDACVTPDVVDELRRAVTDDRRALVSPVLHDTAGRTVFAGARLSLADGRIRSRPDAPLRDPVPWLTGACLAFSDDLLVAAGGLPEGYFLYWEDVEFSRRCAAAGGHLVLREDLVAVHDAGGTQQASAESAKSALYYRWNCRNRLVFAARLLNRREGVRWLAHTPAVGREILLRGGRRQLLRSTRPLRAMLRGSAEGAVVLVGVWLGVPAAHHAAGLPRRTR